MKPWNEQDKFWETWRQDMFPEKGWEAAGAEVDSLLSLMQLSPGSAVLDLACGPGRHALELARLSKGERILRIIGGAPSEDQWRRDLTEAGWYCQRPPIKEVEAGIDRVITLHKTAKYQVFSTCTHYLAQKADYRRKLDEDRLPTEQIDHKDKYHFMDAERYVAAYIVKHGGCAFEH